MSSGFTLACFSASLSTPPNSVSPISTLVLAWSSMKATAGGSSRVLMECSTAPVIGTP